MARPTKTGLDYFPLDTENDDKLELIEAKFGITGFAIIIKLWQRAYKENGYFYPWTEREQLLFSKRVNVDINLINEIIMYAISINIFDESMYKKSVLTSHGMQKRFIEATLRRKSLAIYKDLLLINDDIIPVNVGNNTRQVVFMSYSGTQSKVKGKVNRKESNTPPLGEMKNIFLSSEDHSKLIYKYGEYQVADLIEKMSRWLSMNGKHFKNYYAALLNWAARDGLKPVAHEAECPHCHKPMVDNLCRNGECPQYQEGFKLGEAV